MAKSTKPTTFTFHPYNPTTQQSQQTVPSAKRGQSYSITNDEIKSVLHLPMKQAALELEVPTNRLRTAFKKWKDLLGLNRWPVHKKDTSATTPSDTESNTSPTPSTTIVPVQVIAPIRVKIEDDEDVYETHQTPDLHIGDQVPITEFQRHLLYSNCIQRGEFPLSQFIPGIYFLPPISNDLFDLTLDFANDHHNSDKFIDVPLYTRNMKDFLIYYEMKKLEKDLSCSKENQCHIHRMQHLDIVQLFYMIDLLFLMVVVIEITIQKANVSYLTYY